MLSSLGQQSKLAEKLLQNKLLFVVAVIQGCDNGCLEVVQGASWVLFGSKVGHKASTPSYTFIGDNF